MTTDRLHDDQIRRLVEGDVPWEELRDEILPDPKDPNRFERVREVLQERVDWDEPILVPLNDHLHLVGSDDGRQVKAECGHVLCDAGDNWKHSCQIRVREDEEEMHELYPEYMAADPEWTFQLREFFCPGCYALVDVDTVPAGYPVLQPFEPDVDAFYEEWLGRPAPDRREEGAAD